MDRLTDEQIDILRKHSQSCKNRHEGSMQVAGEMAFSMLKSYSHIINNRLEEIGEDSK